MFHSMALKTLSFYDAPRTPDAPPSAIDNSSGTAYKIVASIFRHLSNPSLIDVEHSFAPNAFVPIESSVSVHIDRGSAYGCDYEYGCCNPLRVAIVKAVESQSK